jgi:hypothetical protein
MQLISDRLRLNYKSCIQNTLGRSRVKPKAQRLQSKLVQPKTLVQVLKVPLSLCPVGHELLVCRSR